MDQEYQYMIPKKQISIRIRKDYLEIIDEFCSQNKISRSGAFFNMAIKDFLKKEGLLEKGKAA